MGMFFRSISKSRISVGLLTLLLALLFNLEKITGQPGGKAFQFLEITNSARVAALGGDMVAVHDTDPELAYHNPALLQLNMKHYATINYVDYFAGANFGYVSAATQVNQKCNLGFGIHYLYYGTFQGADENGVKTGKFRAADYSINIMYARKIDSLFTLGITAKSIYSDYELYNSTALALDVGIIYHNPAKHFSAGLVFRNAGMQVNSYTANDKKEPLPFNIALGFSKSLPHSPFSFDLVYNHLEKWDLTYKTLADKENDEETNETNSESSSKSGFDKYFDQFMRHMVIGTTLRIGKSLELRGGYNYRRRQELKISTKPGMVGFSWGVGLKFTKFKVAYGRSVYHLAGGTNHFSFSMNLDEFSKKF